MHKTTPAMLQVKVQMSLTGAVPDKNIRGKCPHQIEAPKVQRGVGYGERCPLPSPRGGLGRVVSSPAGPGHTQFDVFSRPKNAICSRYGESLHISNTENIKIC